MGYYVEYNFAGLTIPADKHDACLAAINALHADDMLEAKGDSSFGPGVKEKHVRERAWYARNCSLGCGTPRTAVRCLQAVQLTQSSNITALVGSTKPLSPDFVR